MREFVCEDDRKDIKACLEGSKNAFAGIVKRYQKRITGFMWRFTRNREDLEELVHDVFVEAYQSLPRFRGESSLFQWLKTIGMRTGYRYWKKRDSSRVVPLDSVSQPAASQDIGDTDIGVSLYNILERLPARERMILTMHYFDGFDLLEVSKRLGWSYTLVRVQAHRARKILKEKLESAGFGRK
ncbi:MAG: sigma-70 family RNA polymerase sigma factor [Candidatus Wallbacteria bacterium]|nr:sigma-70 family RNA polymerase sigma factor [Candidatus Wallbacteria bacterium]